MNLDAADVVRRALHERVHERVRLLLDLGGRRLRPLLGRPVHLLREELLDEGALRGLHELQEVHVEHVLVPLDEPVHVVVHDACQ